MKKKPFLLSLIILLGIIYVGGVGFGIFTVIEGLVFYVPLSLPLIVLLSIQPDYEVEIKAKHILKGAFTNTWECPIALAVREQYPEEGNTISVGTDYSFIKWKRYNHKPYEMVDYNADMVEALATDNQDTIIRKIKLYKA